MNKKQKKNLIRIILSAILMIVFHFVHHEYGINGIPMLCMYLIPYLLVGYDVIIKALLGIKNLQPLDENLLMTIATVGAIGVALYTNGDFNEAVAVMLFYQIGEWFQSYAVGRSRRNISELMDIRPDYANLVSEDGSVEQVDPDDIEIGSVIQVSPGEKVPLDGTVVDGFASLDTSALTGESVPRSVHVGDEVISGCINMSGVLKIKTSREFDESTVSKILDLVENASSRKSESENFITKFARVYTPIVVICAIALALLPPIFRMAVMNLGPDWTTWVYRALTFLVISCPCALVISIPLSFFAGIGGASREGVLVKGSNYLETLSQTSTVVFDKTGTLTKGVFEVVALHSKLLTEQELLHMAAHVERYSSHPIGLSLKQAYESRYEHEDDGCTVENIEEIAGRGVKAIVNGKEVCVGNSKMMADVGAEFEECELPGTVIHVAVNGEYAGHATISDVVKETSKDAISQLRSAGVKKTVMLTGDAKPVAEHVAAELGLDQVYSELLPADKVTKVEELLAQETGKERLAFVGDGINDAPVLSRADIGIAMGALGSDAAIEAADVVLMDDDPLKISKAIRISRKCLRIVKQNTWFAIGVKIACLVLGALGFVNMWIAIFADVGVMILAVLNAIRALFVKRL